jgi:DNA-binding MarR family transcriptional regulator
MGMAMDIMKTRLLWWLILGTWGGVNRDKIIKCLNKKPYNANQLAEKLHLNYGTIQHHIKILEESDLIESSKNKYNKVYFLSKELGNSHDEFNNIWKEFEEWSKRGIMKCQ